ncbi:MAG: hypothetical protein M1834_002956 [Cirrosporium novae-zelandiae]|nr:MAG: hypothetical protein M1834_002956 [Cirrosporium novae-zelandiae]
MTVLYDFSHRSGSQNGPNSHTHPLEDRFEVIKEVGDGSFGSVVLARVRSGGAHVARRGSLIAIKTMKKTFESFAPCLELREVIFLRNLPLHAHIVPALDIFLDPYSKKLHIAMEYMDGNLYQLMKARDHKCLDGRTVKSILFQILSGLDHIHAHQFFHRDIKPENILVSTSAPHDNASTFSRYSSLVTPPSTPPVYTVKIADFGLARETQSKLPYTTYVSTRWYRAPEVLLRAGEYSAPVDIWAIGAMAVEIATLKPLFPGSNEVDQVWRVCEIMGSPGNWYNKAGVRVGGGDWREGIRLASKLGFSFPKMAPHSIDTILQAPQWPAALSEFVTWCLMWDPKTRPTSQQALNHEYFADAVDPLRPKSSASRLLGRKQSDLSRKGGSRDSSDHSPALSSKSSWFRKSLIGRDSSAPAVPQHANSTGSTTSSRPQIPVHSNTVTGATMPRAKNTSKRATWTNGTTQSGAAPMPILPSIRPISPLSDTVTAQANTRLADGETSGHRSKKIGRQLSTNSTNQQIEAHRLEAERALNGQTGHIASPASGHRESFFSHLRKRARRFSGRHQTPLSPNMDDMEANVGCAPWASNRSSMALDPFPLNASNADFSEVDRASHNAKYGLETPSPSGQMHPIPRHSPSVPVIKSALKRNHSLGQRQSAENIGNMHNGGPISSRTRRALQMSVHPVNQYETPDEEDELLSEALNSAHKAAKRLEDQPKAIVQRSTSTIGITNPYPTPSPSAKRNSGFFGQVQADPATPMNIKKDVSNPGDCQPHWPTPPSEENEWASSAQASILAAGSGYR